MKHLKKFNDSIGISYDLHRKILDEVNNLKYLLEDEGYGIICIPISCKQTMITIHHDLNIEKVDELISIKPEYYLEFIDRLDELCEENNLKFKIRNNYAAIEITIFRELK